MQSQFFQDNIPVVISGLLSWSIDLTGSTGTGIPHELPNHIRLKKFKFAYEPERMVLTPDQEGSFEEIPVLPVWKWLTGINKKGEH